MTNENSGSQVTGTWTVPMKLVDTLNKGLKGSSPESSVRLDSFCEEIQTWTDTQLLMFNQSTFLPTKHLISQYKRQGVRMKMWEQFIRIVEHPSTFTREVMSNWSAPVFLKQSWLTYENPLGRDFLNSVKSIVEGGSKDNLLSIIQKVSLDRLDDFFKPVPEKQEWVESMSTLFQPTAKMLKDDKPGLLTVPDFFFTSAKELLLKANTDQSKALLDAFEQESEYYSLFRFPTDPNYGFISDQGKKSSNVKYGTITKAFVYLHENMSRVFQDRFGGEISSADLPNLLAYIKVTGTFNGAETFSYEDMVYQVVRATFLLGGDQDKIVNVLSSPDHRKYDDDLLSQCRDIPIAWMEELLADG